MKRTLTLAVLLTFVIRHSSSVLAQGPLVPPGAPAPTMKTLDQVEARTPISSAPFTSRGTSTSGNGLAATNAFNCEGISTSGAFGINANNGTASFCRAERDGGVAIGASNAIGCTVIGTGTVTATT